jgi:hypothetical protein
MRAVVLKNDTYPVWHYGMPSFNFGVVLGVYPEKPQKMTIFGVFLGYFGGILGVFWGFWGH